MQRKLETDKQFTKHKPSTLITLVRYVMTGELNYIVSNDVYHETALLVKASPHLQDQDDWQSLSLSSALMLQQITLALNHGINSYDSLKSG